METHTYTHKPNISHLQDLLMLIAGWEGKHTHTHTNISHLQDRLKLIAGWEGKRMHTQTFPTHKIA